MRKSILILFVLLSSVSVVFACVGNDCVATGNVKDNNDGNPGDILVNICDTGNNDVGQWVDPKDIPELKGEKGDQGEQGIQGEAGSDGQDGIDGQDGVNGTDGKNGIDGKNGKDGEKGDRGDQGRGLKDPKELKYKGVIKSWKKAELCFYYVHDFENDLDTVGLEVKHYWGKSWTEKEIERLEEKINQLTK